MTTLTSKTTVQTSGLAAQLLKWLGPDRSDASIERCARWMRDGLRVGSITDCRAMLRSALNGDWQR